MGTNDAILILVILFFSYLLLARHHEDKRRADRRKQALGPPDGLERRSGRDPRSRGPVRALGWLLHAQARRVGAWFRRPGR